MPTLFPENVKDIVQSALMQSITGLGFQIREVTTKFPPKQDDMQLTEVIFWSAEIEVLVPQKDSTVEIAGQTFNETAPEWVKISSRLHFLPQDDSGSISPYIIEQTASRSGAFTALVAMRPDRMYIYQAIQDYGLYPNGLFVAEAIRLGYKTIETGDAREGHLMDPAKVIQWMEKFMRDSIATPLITHYKRLKNELK